MYECEEYWPGCPVCESTWGRQEYASWFFAGWQAPLRQYGYFVDQLRNSSTLWELRALAEFAQLPTYFYVRPRPWTATVTTEDGADVEYLSWLMGPPWRWGIDWPQNPDRQWRELRAGVDIARRNDDLDAMTYAFTTMPKEKPMKTREEKIEEIQRQLTAGVGMYTTHKLAERILDALEPLPKPPRKIRVWAVINPEGKIQEVRSPDSVPEPSQRAWPTDHKLVSYDAMLVDEN